MAKNPDHGGEIAPLDLSDEARHLDVSGTPAGLIELARRNGDLALLDEVDEAEILVEFPMSDRWRRQTGYVRFVRLRRRRQGKRYALVGRL